ncbi:extracellular solute-binding protein [Isoptericola sp. 4D.3]|jgi:multiple sugar transport system substrate-binding protein|uniref:Extracellular solute-binding protein n=1 Tax=Isoptericola peretonis TaxID=2918523 RepID=A0ABT0J488_9MICO|nr:extracellular solute-binding protein [Isoptericola sp. 4D.3]
MKTRQGTSGAVSGSRPSRAQGRFHRRSGPSGAADDVGLSRRHLLQAALVGAGGVALGGALSGCATPEASGSGRTSVMIWDLFSGGDGALMQEMVGAVAKANPDIAVDSTTLAWGAPYYTKLAMASSGGRPPEAAVMHMSRLAGYAPGGLLEPFDLDALADLGVTQDHFAPAVWEKAQFDGQLYALPLDTHPYIAFHNPAIAGDAGLLGADGRLAIAPGADAFLDAGRAMAEVTGETGVSWGYLRDPAGCWRTFWGLYNQNGGGYDLTPGKPAELDERAAEEVFEFLQEMVDGTVAAKNQDGGAASGRFMSDRTGVMFAGEWDLPMFRDANPDVGASPFPAIFDQPANYADSHSFVLPRQARPDPAKREATYRVLAGLLKEGLTWASAGHIPAYQPVVETPEYQELTPQRDYASAAEIAVFDPDAWFTGGGSDFQTRMGDSMTDTLSGKATPASAVTRILGEMNRFLSQPSPA